MGALDSHSFSFDHLCRPDTLRTTIAIAFFWPTISIAGQELHHDLKTFDCLVALNVSYLGIRAAGIENREFQVST